MYIPKRKRKKLNETNRMKLFRQCHGRCWYCGAQIGKKAFRLDHQQPFSKNGADSKRNLVVACGYCDGLKKAMRLEEFREFLSAITMQSVMIFYGERIDGCWSWKGNNQTSKEKERDRILQRQ